MRKLDDTISLLRLLRDVGCEVGQSGLVNFTDPASYPSSQLHTVAHIALGRLTSMSITEKRLASRGAFFRWLSRAPARPRVLFANYNTQAYLDVGRVILFLDGSSGNPAKCDWNVTVYGSPDALLDYGVWISSLPKKRAVAAKPFVHFIAENTTGLYLKPVEVPRKPGSQELDLLYGDDFPSFHASVVGRLKDSTSGIVFLHGPPGGGKTSYIRTLTGCLAKHKRVVVVPKTMVERITTPAFTSFMLGMKDQPCVLVVEDAEKLVAADARTTDGGTSVLLNLTDGLLNDVTKVQAVVTFNCPVAKVDPALLRSGRLIGMREFGPLTAAQARRLAEHHGKDASHIRGPTMLCDVLADAAIGAPTPSRPVLGFANKGLP